MSALELAEPGPRHHMAWAKRAILLVDIVGSVRLIDHDEVGIISDWLDFVDRVQHDTLLANSGRLIKNLGDGLLIDFDDVRSAVSAALAIQEARRQANAARPAAGQIQLRMGLEVSDVIVEGNDVLGRGVNLAARLMSLAGPGEIVVSQHVRDGLTAGLDADLEDLGDCYVRNLPQPVRAYRVGPSGPQPVVGPSAALDDLAPTIAVVPFTSRGAADDHGLIGEILAEELIRRLSHEASGLRVVSRLSTTAFSGRDASLDEIATHLGADYVLSGAYRGGLATLRLCVELAEARSGRILWSDSLADKVAAIVDGEGELVGRLLAGVSAAVTTRELQRSRTQPLPTLRSYTLLMGAVSLMHRLSPADFDEAHRLLQALIDRGVHHPLPIAWLGYWHVLRVQQGWSTDEARDTYMAAECTRRALDMDPDNSLALAINGFAHVNLMKRFDIAEESYERALEINPSNALAWLLKGTLHAFRSEGPKAVDHTERALQLSPLDPHRYFYDSLATTACLSNGEDERALKLAQRSLRANRKHTSTWRVMTIAQWRLGRFDEARRSALELMKLQPSLTVGGWLKASPAADFPIGRVAAEILRKAGVPE
ncbi:MAG: adenylate/guanylate cyclase domain-containing protein [Reyranella sp.]|uniref:adenylate/guanylate cyclase domain-containing protein n=1 Tax=Reyranella sp. TaxID=1929291 RepID=UPI003D13C87E